MRTSHQRQLKTFYGITVGADGNLIHTNVGGGDFCTFWKEEETPGGLTGHIKSQSCIVSTVVDAVCRSRDELGLTAKHIESRLGDAVVNIAIIGHVDAQVARVVPKFKVKPNAANVARPLIRGHGVEAEDGHVKRSFDAVLNRDAACKACRRDFNER